MVEVVKPIIMANAVNQGLQRSYFSIRAISSSKPNKSDVRAQLPC